MSFRTQFLIFIVCSILFVEHIEAQGLPPGCEEEIIVQYAEKRIVKQQKVVCKNNKIELAKQPDWDTNWMKSGLRVINDSREPHRIQVDKIQSLNDGETLVDSINDAHNPLFVQPLGDLIDKKPVEEAYIGSGGENQSIKNEGIIAHDALGKNIPAASELQYFKNASSNKYMGLPRDIDERGKQLYRKENIKNAYESDTDVQRGEQQYNDLGGEEQNIKNSNIIENDIMLFDIVSPNRNPQHEHGLGSEEQITRNSLAFDGSTTHNESVNVTDGRKHANYADTIKDTKLYLSKQPGKGQKLSSNITIVYH